MTARRYTILDVFTKDALAGNPLAVVLDAQSLDDARMQAIAKEFNLSETVFVLPPDEPGHRAKLRIFTPNFELPFAGHPTIGTAMLLALSGGPSDFVLGEKVGPIPCRTRVETDRSGHADFDVAELPRRIGDIGEAPALAAALGLEAGDIGFAGAAPGHFTAGSAYSIVPLASKAAVDRAAVVSERWADAFGMQVRRSVFIVARGDAEDVFYARMFASGRNFYEDPATGSAAAACAALLHSLAPLADGSHRRTIEQGYAMGRPSQIEVTLHVKDGALVGTTIGGHAVVVAQGTLNA